MKLVKDLQKWISGYNEVKTLADELELAFDFYKEELVTEEDVDAAYAKPVRRWKHLNSRICFVTKPTRWIVC